MTIILDAVLFAKLCPNAPKTINAAFVAKQHLISEILQTPERLALAIANIYAETSGYALSGLIENIHYTAAQTAHEWPNRFKSAADVQAKYGTAPGWQNKAFDSIYGDRMGNRPNTSDGSQFIGRGGPQLTGRDEYGEIGKAIGKDLLSNPSLASSPDLQPDILGAYWRIKNFSKYADAGNIVEARKIWNGGTNGLAVVESEYPKLLKIIKSYTPTTAAVVVAAPTATKDDELAHYQQALIDLGYHEIGDVDGLMGGKTKGAIAAFCNDRNRMLVPYPSTALDAEIGNAINEHWHRPVAPARAFATTADIAPKVASIAPTQKASLMAKIGAWFGAGTATAQGVMSVVPTAHDTAAPYVAMLSEYWEKVPHWVPFSIVGAVAFAIYHQTNKANNATTAAYQQGKIN